MKTTIPAVLLILLILIGCGRGAETPAETRAEKPPTSAQPANTLTFQIPILPPIPANPMPEETPEPAPAQVPAIVAATIADRIAATATPQPRRVMLRGEEMLEAAALAVERGLELMRLERYEEAALELESAGELQGRPSRLIAGLRAHAEQELGNHAEAIRQAGIGLGIADVGMLRTVRASSLETTSRCPAAIHDAQRALGMPRETGPEQGGSIAEAQRILALCQRAGGDALRALEHGERAAEAALESGAYGEQKFHERFEVLLERLAAEAPAIPEPEPEPAVIKPEDVSIKPTPLPAATPKPPPRNGGATARLTGIDGMKRVRQTNPAAFGQIGDLGWPVADPTGENETIILTELARLLNQPGMGNGANALINMPFLESPTLGDREALAALREIWQADQSQFKGILNHPAVMTAGITDDMTPGVAALPQVLGRDPALTAALLNPAALEIVERTIPPPHSGDTRLAVVQFRGPSGGAPAAADFLDRLWDSVRETGRHMGQPLPAGMVVLLVAEFAGNEPGIGPGVSTRTSIIVPPGGGVPLLRRRITRQVAGYYWNGNEPWLDQGMSEYIATLRDRERGAEPLSVTVYPCGEYPNLGRMPERGGAHHCDLSLGSRLFLELHRQIGNGGLQQTMSRVYLRSLEEGAGPMGRRDIRESFPGHEHDTDGGHGSGNSHGAGVLNRWFDGAGDYEPAAIDRSEPKPEFTDPPGMVTALRLRVEGQDRSGLRNRGNRQRAKLRVEYEYLPGNEPGGQPRGLVFQLVVTHEDGIRIREPDLRVPVQTDGTGRMVYGMTDVEIGPPAGRTWAAGEYTAQLYRNGQKLAEKVWHARR